MRAAVMGASIATWAALAVFDVPVAHAQAPASDPSAPAADAAPSASPATAPAASTSAAPATSAPSTAPSRPQAARPYAPNPAPYVDEPPELTPAPPTPRIDAWLGVGARVIPDAAFDVFSGDDSLTSFDAGLGADVADVGSAHVAVVASLSLAGTESRYRGQQSDLSLLHLAVGPELRVPFAGRFFAYGRVSPLLVHSAAELEEASSLTTLQQSEWLVGVDTALGVALRLTESRVEGLTNPLCIFARLEAGYAWAPDMQMELSPTASNGPIRSEPLDLGELSLSSASFRAALGLGY